MTTKAPPRTPGRGLGHAASAAPTLTRSSSSSVAANTINIVGIPLNSQELMNAIYSGPFITKAKAEFSNSQNANMQKWSSFITGNPKRQEVLAVALEWVSDAQGISVDAYLATHRHDDSIDRLKTYFTSVIDWIGSVFTRPPDKEMRGLDWGRLYESYHSKSYDAAAVDADVDTLRADPAVLNNKGIYEYVLAGVSWLASS